MRVEIRPATLRDVSYVIAHMRQVDADEIWCQLPEDQYPAAFAHHIVTSGISYTAWIGKHCVAAFGTQPLNVVSHLAWAFGTDRMQRAVPAITDFLAERHIPELIRDGVLMMEARSHSEHEQAHRWLLSTGAKVVGDDFPFGRGEEAFRLFRWTVPEYHAITARKSRWQRQRKSYVYQQT